MGRVSSTAASAIATTQVANPSISNTAVLAGTEYTVTLPAGTRRFSIRHRGSAKLEIRLDPGDPEFFTSMPGNVFQEKELSPSSTYTFYITPNKDGVLEVLSWA